MSSRAQTGKEMRVNHSGHSGRSDGTALNGVIREGVTVLLVLALWPMLNPLWPILRRRLHLHRRKVARHNSAIPPTAPPTMAPISRTDPFNLAGDGDDGVDDGSEGGEEVEALLVTTR
ncbi:hypothetical protein BD779DRAFT_1479381 [Infundibulicybe gibba]|nr:hypothetical protein BD779DRAFT_1479381 [Infundibulicybe gibba]